MDDSAQRNSIKVEEPAYQVDVGIVPLNASDDNLNKVPDSTITARNNDADACSDLTDNNNEGGEEQAPKSFPQKLMDILSDESLSDTISWLPHGTGFQIHKKKTFAAEVLPQFFKASKFTSFTRKLNRWGFTRVPRGPETGAYFHKLFRRDKPELCLQMTSNSGNKYQANPMMQPSLLPNMPMMNPAAAAGMAPPPMFHPFAAMNPMAAMGMAAMGGATPPANPQQQQQQMQAQAQMWQQQMQMMAMYQQQMQMQTQHQMQQQQQQQQAQGQAASPMVNSNNNKQPLLPQQQQPAQQPTTSPLPVGDPDMTALLGGGKDDDEEDTNNGLHHHHNNANHMTAGDGMPNVVVPPGDVTKDDSGEDI